MPSPEAMRDPVAADLKMLQGLQNDDGGFGFWRRGEQFFPLCLRSRGPRAGARAEQRLRRSPEMLSNSRNYLRESMRRFRRITALNHGVQFRLMRSMYVS